MKKSFFILSQILKIKLKPENLNKNHNIKMAISTRIAKSTIHRADRDSFGKIKLQRLINNQFSHESNLN